jgi:hypothetical protein
MKNAFSNGLMTLLSVAGAVVFLLSLILEQPLYRAVFLGTVITIAIFMIVL